MLIGLVVLLAGCSQSSGNAALTGIIDHSHRMNLPVGTIVIVQIRDTTRAGSEGVKVAEQVIDSQGDELPMPFTVIYNSHSINQKHTYSVSAKIEDSDGKLLYISGGDTPVLTKGNPTHDIDIEVVLFGG